MLYIPWMVILGDHNIIKTSFENFIFELPGVKSCISTLCTNPLGAPPPPPLPPGPNTQIGGKTCRYGLKHALHNLDGHFT